VRDHPVQSVADRSCCLADIDDEGHAEAVASREAGADDAGADSRDLHAGSGDVDAQGLEQVAP
jgi:hypothetical protein